MQYHRPTTLEQAIELLKTARPLGGGTALTPERRKLEAVIDLQDLDLGGFSIEGESIHFGAGARLQEILDAGDKLPPGLINAVRHETAWNLRNAATLAGVVVRSDGRSPLLTVLTAMDASLELEPGRRHVDLVSFFGQRHPAPGSNLITRIDTANPARLAFAMVARAPMDRPIVSACAARRHDGGIGLALGGFGSHPVRLPDVEPGGNADQAGRAAAAAYAAAGDDFASAEYRSAVAAVLIKRVLVEVLA
jgi:CO/xanthine dehydrogenase FAD-binding subunit